MDEKRKAPQNGKGQDLSLSAVHWNGRNVVLPFSEALENIISAEASISETKSNHLPSIMHFWASTHNLLTSGSAVYKWITNLELVQRPKGPIKQSFTNLFV